MSDDPWLEVSNTVAAMIRNLRPLVDRRPDATIQGDDFNLLLARAKAALPNSPAIRDVKKIDGATTVADLISKLSIL